MYETNPALAFALAPAFCAARVSAGSEEDLVVTAEASQAPVGLALSVLRADAFLQAHCQ